jgi:hypothetical protein
MQSKKTNIAFLTLVFVLSVAAMTYMALTAFNTGQEISGYTYVYSLNQRSAGKVAGVAVERAVVNIDRLTGTTLSTEVSLNETTNVLEALQEAAKTYGLSLDVETSSSFGAYVNGIGDMKGGQDNRYWLYYINTQPGTVAVDKQVVKPGDTIEFKFEQSIF